MADKNQKQRPIDQTVGKAASSLASRFVLASKTEIKAWKAFAIIVFAAGFFSALAWSAYNGWYIQSGAESKKVKEAAMEAGASGKMKLKKLIHVGNLAKNEKGKTVPIDFELLEEYGESILKDVEKSPFDGYAVRVHGGVGEMCNTGVKIPGSEDISSGVKAAKNFEKSSGKEIWPYINWSTLIPCAEKGCCNGDSCPCNEEAMEEEEGAEEEGTVCSDKNCACGGKCEYATAIDPWNEKFVANFVKLHKTAFQASKELGVEGIVIDPEFYRDHKNYTIEYIQEGLAKKGISKSPAEIEAEFKQIGHRVADSLVETYGDKKGVVLWMFFADLGNSGNQFKTKYLKTTDCITEGILERAKEKAKVIDGGEHLLRYIHPSLAVKVQKKNLKVSLEESIAARKPVLDYAKGKNLDKYFELGGVFGLYQDINKLGCSWGLKADQWCPGTKGSCDEKTDIWKWADSEPERWCPEVEIRTLDDHLPLVRRLFEEYEYVWAYSGDGKPVYNELSPDVNPSDREKFRSLIVRARSCGTNGCEERMGETIENCSVDCAPNSPNISCGDGQCKGDETCSSCDKDCGACDAPGIISDSELQSCGDGQCKGDETCSICDKDCGVCQKEDPLAPSIVIKNTTRQISSEEPYYTTSKRIDFKGSLPDISGGKVRVFQNGRTKKIIKVKPSGAWRGKIDLKKAGTYSFQIKYYDKSGAEVDTSDVYEVVKK